MHFNLGLAKYKEITMSTTQTSKAQTIPKTPVDMKLEVIVVPVADVERAKHFYENLGWRVDGDFSAGDSWRVVQLTPTGSPCSIFIGKGLTSVAPGTAQGMLLVVDDAAAARAELLARGVEVSNLFHFSGPIHVTGDEGRVSGPDPQDRSYYTWASFADPDGNGWMLQEIKARLPGRGFSSLDVPNLIDLLKETERLHGEYEATAPKHHWSGWYAAYMVARSRGRAPVDAAKDAGQYMEGARR